MGLESRSGVCDGAPRRIVISPRHPTGLMARPSRTRRRWSRIPRRSRHRTAWRSPWQPTPETADTAATAGDGCVHGERFSGVFFVADDGVAVLTLEEAAQMLAVAELIDSRGAEIKQSELLPELQRFGERLRDGLGAEGAAASRIDVDAREREIATFLAAQVKVRAALTMRIRRTCADCNTVRILNPAFQDKLNKAQKRSSLARTASGGFMAVMGNPLALWNAAEAGRVGKLTMGPHCNGCDGEDVTDSLAYGCPNCKTWSDDAVLKRCRKCGYDLLAKADIGALWQARDTVTLPAAAGRLLTTFSTPVEPTALSFHPDGETLLVGTRDRSVHRWRVGGASRLHLGVAGVVGAGDRERVDARGRRLERQRVQDAGGDPAAIAVLDDRAVVARDHDARAHGRRRAIADPVGHVDAHPAPDAQHGARRRSAAA